MKKTALVFFAFCALIACKPKPTADTPSSGDAAFQKLADDYIDGYLAMRPSSGVYLGYHQYDGKVSDYSKASLDKELARLKDFEAKLAATDTTALGPKAFLDYRILRSAIKQEIFSF